MKTKFFIIIFCLLFLFPKISVAVWINPVSAVGLRGDECNVNNILIEDGLGAGMDYYYTSHWSPDGTHYCVGAIKVDFGGAYPITQVRVVWRDVDMACKSSCCCGYCDTTAGKLIFHSLDGSSWTYIGGDYTFSSTWVARTYSITTTTRYLLVCRGSGGPAREDVQVDVVQIYAITTQPDLIIEDIWNVGSTIYYRIKNQGTASAGASNSKLWVDGVEKATDNVGTLAAGASSEETFATYSWICSGASDTIKVCADVGNAVSESNENNNCREETWSCPSFDFSLSVNPNSGTVTQGGSVTTTVTANLISGTSQPVSFSCGGGNWLTGWQYRKPITITERSGNTLTNYQVLINLDTASLISAGKMRSDCGDIRFTDSDGISLLNYWIESGCNNANTKIWVNVTSIPAGSTKTIYVYYGNPSATSQSNGITTFIFFDDFSTNPANRWRDIFRYSNDVANEFYWDGTVLYLTKAVNNKGGGGTMVLADSTWENTWAIRFKFKAGGGSGADGLAFGFFHEGNAWNGGTSLSVGKSGYAVEMDNYKSTNDATANHIAIVRTSAAEAPYGYTHLARYDTGATEDNVWHSVEVKFYNNNIKIWLDGTLILDYSTTFDKTYKRFLFGGATGGATNNHIIDDIIIRKYVSPEPTVSVGNEEQFTAQLPPGVTCTFNPSSCSPTCNSILTISTSPTTPTGTHTITIVGTSSGITSNWLTGWQYRKPITITERSGNTLTNYQVLINLDTASLISAGKMRSDCGDIRFTDSDGISLLNYWIESGCNNANTKIWVNVTSIPAGSTKTIYVYYGNPSATSQSNSANVFGKAVSLVYNRDNYYISLILANREWVSGGAKLGISGDDSGASRTLPASRVVYGTTISAVYLSTNGLLRWDNVADNRYSNYLDTSKKILTAHWDDLYISTSYRSDAGIYEITGSDSVGNYIAYRWATTYYSSTSTPADFEILLYDTKYIQFNVYRVWSSASPNEFISKGDGSNYIDLTPRWRNMESVLFVPRVYSEPTTSVGNEEQFTGTT
jgi:ABC-type transporter Mla MlaB component